jgi:hypothetical protein
MQPDWMARVVVGSVLANGNSPWRVVRRVSRKANGDLWGVYFAIRHCSWTGRCYTVVTASDLKVRGFRLMPVRAREFRSEIDIRIQRAINSNECRGHYSVTCCDVKGVA